MNDLRERVKREIDTVADNPAYDCVTNRYVATDRIIALLAETPGEADNEAFKATLGAYLQLNPSSDPAVLMQGFAAGWIAKATPALASPPSDQGLRDVAQRLLSAIDRAMVEDDDLPDGIDGTLIDDLREALASKKGGTP
jgi:hypothetical protein